MTNTTTNTNTETLHAAHDALFDAWAMLRVAVAEHFASVDAHTPLGAYETDPRVVRAWERVTGAFRIYAARKMLLGTDCSTDPGTLSDYVARWRAHLPGALDRLIADASEAAAEVGRADRHARDCAAIYAEILAAFEASGWRSFGLALGLGAAEHACEVANARLASAWEASEAAEIAYSEARDLACIPLGRLPL